MLKTKVIDLTPEIAKKYIAINTGNRRVSPELVSSYAEDMKKGRWHTNGEPIILSNDTLISGQHRCLAVIKSGVTLKDIIVVNTDDPEMIDTGRPRSAADLYGISTYHSAMIAINIKMATKKKTVSKALVFEKYKEWKNECDYVYSLIYARNSKLRKASLAGAVLAAYLCGYPEDLLERFCKVLTSGETTSPNDKIIIALRDSILLTNSLSGETQKKLYLKTQAALKIYAEGRTVAKLFALSEPYYKIRME